MDAHSSLSLSRTVALVGLMGAGKSAIGKRLAMRLGLAFVDADDEIERAAGCSIAEFFEKYGESDFRAGERRVIARLLDEPPHVLSTGGGAYIDADTRALMRAKAVTVPAFLAALSSGYNINVATTTLDSANARTFARAPGPSLRIGAPLFRSL